MATSPRIIRGALALTASFVMLSVLSVALPGTAVQAQQNQAQQQIYPPVPPPGPPPPPMPPRPPMPPPMPHPIIQRNLTLTDMNVKVEIRGALAHTTIRQTLRNDNGWLAEGQYMLPLPAPA